MRAFPPVLVGVDDFSGYRLGSALTEFRKLQDRLPVWPLLSPVVPLLNVAHVDLTILKSDVHSSSVANRFAGYLPPHYLVSHIVC